MTARFVILHHRLADSEHWDLMLEMDGKLATWQLPRPLTSPADLPMTARRIGDHRLAYLTYEGPISDDRGEVTRATHGCYTVANASSTELRLQFDLELCPAPIILEHECGDSWRMRIAGE